MNDDSLHGTGTPLAFILVSGLNRSRHGVENKIFDIVLINHTPLSVSVLLT